MSRKQLVTLLAAGDEGAWRRFLAEFGKLIYSVSGRFGFEAAERDDHFQGVCLAVLRSVSGLRAPDRMASWIYNVSVRLAIDMRRRAARAPGRNLTAAEEAEASVPPLALEELERTQLAALLHDALDRLDPRCRRLLQALFLEDPAPGYTEISRREGIPVGSIGPNRARCLEKLGKIFAGLSNEPSSASIASSASVEEERKPGRPAELDAPTEGEGS